MFAKLLTTNYFADVAQTAQSTFIKMDREQYYPIFELVKKLLAKDDKTVLSEPMLLPTLVNSAKSVKNNKSNNLKTSMTLYTMYPRKISTEIANAIHKEFGKFTQMRAMIPNEEYSIMYDMRGLITVHRIDRYKQIPLNTLFKTNTQNNLEYFPAEIELIDIYRKLYLPNYIEEYDDIRQCETAMFNLFAKSHNIKTGGAESDALNKNCEPCRVKRQISIHHIQLLMLKFFHNKKYAFVGEWAHSFMLDSSVPDNNTPIQIISENSIDQDYKNIALYLSKFTKYGIFYKKKKIYIPKDTRMCKYTLFIKFPNALGKGIDKPFMDIYNCANYELIPFIPLDIEKSTLNVGNLNVQMRFLFIDLWLMHFINLLNGPPESQITKSSLVEEKKKYTLNTITKLKSPKVIKKFSFDSVENFIGINYDEKVSQKIEISQKQLKKDSYYPELSMKNSKKYQLIATTS
jgi:superoxide dismutase